MKDKRLQSTSRREFHRMALLAASSFGLLGCATTTPSTSVATTQDPIARPLPLTFKTPEVRQQLESVGLLESFTRYWNHYAQRRWSERYEMERFQKDKVSQEFYEGYYRPASIIKAFEVLAVYTDEKGRVRIQVRAEFESRDNPKKTDAFLLQDWWATNESNQWEHLNHDPILNRAGLTL